MLIAEILTLLFPAISTLAANLFIGTMFMMGGLIILLGSFSIRGTGPFFGSLLFSLLTLGFGLFLLVKPSEGAITLTLVMAIVLLSHGIRELLFAFIIRPTEGWFFVLLSGILGVVLAVLLAANLVTSSRVLLGVIVGIHFLASGVAQLMLSRCLKRVVIEPIT